MVIHIWTVMTKAVIMITLMITIVILLSTMVVVMSAMMPRKVTIIMTPTLLPSPAIILAMIAKTQF